MNDDPSDPEREDRSTVALVGCPNVGKSVVFNALASGEVEVSNYPGTTLQTTVAPLADYDVVDTPGVHGISSFSDEEQLVRDVILEVDAVINVVDATSLDRDLFLTLQLLDMGIPTVVALNMMDEATRDGLDIDVAELEARLGAPVVPTVAVDGQGIDALRSRVPEATAPASSPVLERFDRLPDGLEASRAEKTLALEADRPTIASLGSDGDVVADGGTALDVDEPLREAVYRHRRERVADITAAAVAARERASTIAARLDDLLMNPRTGAPLILALLGLLYLLIGDLVAQRLVDFLEIEVFGALYVPAVQRLVSSVLPSGGLYDPLQYVLINENLGVLTITVQYIVGVLLPLVVAFYLFIGLLEDSGILPRLAVLTDRGLSRIGLNGRAIVPMIVGVGCVTMAVVTTRMVGSRRERLIATGLLGLAIPCSAQLGVILGLLAGLGFGWFLAYLAVLLLVFGVAGLALDRVLPGESEALLTELPRLRRPRLGNILTKTSRRTRMFLREAVPLFGVAALGISVLDYVGGLGAIERALEPVTRLVGLPVEFGQVLVLGVIRRDFAAAGMTDLALSPGQIFVGLVVVTLFVPCILSMVVIGKERGLKAGLVMWLGSWIVALLVGLGVSVVVL